ncbi:hypothetical protein EXIGLDRAFT_508994 [Exidia glandulosa HHB12029]|uniref:Uncharacterized protein n=1 Tax=Exidia glandulosa HHB12029 TaxID=1314781 RepID=A0A165PD87_EXIGL|nr:hypothetical protein EXIGLDRAFT_508994 [Exidia glandulosa HHB12029]
MEHIFEGGHAESRRSAKSALQLVLAPKCQFANRRFQSQLSRVRAPRTGILNLTAMTEGWSVHRPEQILHPFRLCPSSSPAASGRSASFFILFLLLLSFFLLRNGRGDAQDIGTRLPRVQHRRDRLSCARHRRRSGSRSCPARPVLRSRACQTSHSGQLFGLLDLVLARHVFSVRAPSHCLHLPLIPAQFPCSRPLSWLSPFLRCHSCSSCASHSQLSRWAQSNL